MTQSVLLDVNVLLALSCDAHEHHERAHARFAHIDSWSTTPITELGLLRLMMTPAVMGRTVSASAARAQVKALRSADGWSWVADDVSPAEWGAGGYALRGRRQVTDLQLVNLAARHECVLATFDDGIRHGLRPKERAVVDVWD
ncbi:TA system VapC family ribonuclease toxin [Microbacterium sp.]|uniref:TA system VapC family ribonuclease toxin n=1 Tax=Microbacterium sp. TaxID=51671 RepID=UPI0026035CA2|nr:TA system VapC family ribonuclease toxin [Microbacterium sp.]